LCYSERQFDIEIQQGEIERLYLNSGRIPFYQGTGGAIEWYGALFKRVKMRLR